MKIKTFDFTDMDLRDSAVNQFESKNKVKATQTYVYVVGEVPHYVAVAFYEPKE